MIIPEALTEIQQILRLIQSPVKFGNDVCSFSKYDEIKGKITRASSLLGTSE